MCGITLRDYQRECVAAVRNEWEKGIRSTLATLATGAGKTEIALAVLSEELRDGKVGRILFLVHTIELTYQPIQRIDKSWPEFFGMTGIVQAQSNDVNARFIVATWQSLSRGRLDDILAFGPITHLVLDEAHRSVSSGISTIVKRLQEENPEMRVFGMTATPNRTDKDGLIKIFQSVCYKFPINKAIKAGALVPFSALGVALPDTDISQIKQTENGWDDDEMGEILSADNVKEIVYSNWQKYCKDRLTIGFTASVNQAERMSEYFNARGVKSASICGETPKNERKIIISDFKSGKIRVLFNVFVLVEGFDCLDDQTEILTPDGWRGKGRVQEGDSVYSMNRDTGKMEITPILKYIERPVQPGEQMVQIRSQHVNVRVTEGHEFHIKYIDPRTGQRSKTWQTRTGREMLGRRSHYALPLSAELEDLPGLPLTDDEIRLIAWFMTDGTMDSVHRGLFISQAKEYHHEIRALLQRLGFDFSERCRKPGKGAYANSKPIYEFRIPKGTDHGSKKRNGWVKYEPYLDKNVSPLLQQMTRQQFSVFWKELLKGDGSNGSSGNRAGWLWCDRKEQADSYTHLAVVRGFAASCQPEITKHGTQVWRVSVRDSQWITSTPCDVRSARATAEDPKPGESVWCVRNRNSTLVTRRNGKIAIIGNCPETGAVMMIAPTKSDLVYAQRLGRGLRLAPNKADCVVLDFSPVGGRNIIMAGDVLGLPKAARKAQERAEKQGVLFSFQFDQLGEAKTIDPADLIVHVLDLLSAHFLAWTADNRGAVAAIGDKDTGRTNEDGKPIKVSVSMLIEFPDNPAQAAERIKKADALKASGQWLQEWDQEYNKLTYKLWLIEGNRAQIIGQFSSIDAAQNRGDEIAAENYNAILGDKKREWRKEPATTGQINFMNKLKVEVPPNCRKGQAAQLITTALAWKAVKRERSRVEL